MSRARALFARSFIFLAVLGLCGCGSPTPDPSSNNGIQQILDAVDVDLTNQDCADALTLILPVYNSSNSNNEVRMKTASAYGCSAGINFFDTTQNLSTNPALLVPPSFWALMVQLFPSQSGKDHRMEGAFFGTDALEAVLNPGVLILPANEVGAGTNNVGSVFPADRTLDSNLYLMYVAMAGIGTAESRYGTNNGGATTNRANLLPFTTAGAVTADGCGLAASVLNFLDAFGAAGASLPSAVASAFGAVQSEMQSGIDAACAAGCNNTVPASGGAYNTNGNWVQSGCAAATPCSVCPSALRNRSSCSGQASDVNSCAAAGLTNFLNSSALGWQP